MLAPFSADELALLTGIHATPRDDLPRLVYADWLDDCGEPEHAEFVRLQCGTAARCGPWAACEYTPRERALVRKFGARWRRHRLPLGGATGAAWGVRFLRFHRGLPEAHLLYWNDDYAIRRAEYVDRLLGPHYQLYLTVNVVRWGRECSAEQRNAFGWHSGNPLFARAHRLHLRSLRSDADADDEVPMTARDAHVAAKIALSRNRLAVCFGSLTPAAAAIVNNKLASHPPTFMPDGLAKPGD